MKNQIYTFKVHLHKDLYRIIEIRGNKSLYNLADIIIQSFDFDMDHAFGFYDKVRNAKESYELFADSEFINHTVNLLDDFIELGKSVKKTLISSVFTEKKKMEFLFDYGDEWIFYVQCQKISDPEPKIKYPRIIKSVGESPEQYPEYDDDAYDYDFGNKLMEITSLK